MNPSGRLRRDASGWVQPMHAEVSRIATRYREDEAA